MHPLRGGNFFSLKQILLSKYVNTVQYLNRGRLMSSMKIHIKTTKPRLTLKWLEKSYVSVSDHL